MGACTSTLTLAVTLVVTLVVAAPGWLLLPVLVCTTVGAGPPLGVAERLAVPLLLLLVLLVQLCTDAERSPTS